MMTDAEFLDRAEGVLRAIEATCDEVNDSSYVDIDNQRVGAMVTLTFVDRSQIIVNLQKPLHEIWLATKAGGFHYHWVNSQWQDTKGQGELFSALTHHVSAQAGITVRFET
jgi:CyaY protein